MTLSQTSSRLGALVGAFATSAVLLFAAPQAHANSGRYYTVVDTDGTFRVNALPIRMGVFRSEDQ